MGRSEIWIVTGASRGIGTEFVAQILSKSNTQVVAGARSPGDSKGLQDLKQQHAERLHLLTLDVADTSSIQDAAKRVSQLTGIDGVDYVINNAGASNPGQSRLEPVETLRQTLEVNVVGVHAMTQAFLPLLQSGNKKTVINISSGSGSLSRRFEEVLDAHSCLGISGCAPRMIMQFEKRHEKESKHLPTSLGYKTSKAALNMLTLAWASDVTPEEGFTFAAIHPGVVNTDMNTRSMRALKYDEAAFAARLTPTEAVEQLLNTISHLTTADSGRYLNLDGKPITF